MENKQVPDASGKAGTLTQTGSYFANVGEMTIKADGSIATKLISTYEGHGQCRCRYPERMGRFCGRHAG